MAHRVGPTIDQEAWDFVCGPAGPTYGLKSVLEGEATRSYKTLLRAQDRMRSLERQLRGEDDPQKYLVKRLQWAEDELASAQEKHQRAKERLDEFERRATQPSPTCFQPYEP